MAASAANVPRQAGRADLIYGAGGGMDTTGAAIWGGAYSILGDGTTPIRGLITQTAVADYLGVPRLTANTNYSVRARVRATETLLQGTVHVNLYSALSGIFDSREFPNAARNASEQYGVDGIHRAARRRHSAWASFPPIRVLRVCADGTLKRMGPVF